MADGPETAAPPKDDKKKKRRVVQKRIKEVEKAIPASVRKLHKLGDEAADTMESFLTAKNMKNAAMKKLAKGIRSCADIPWKNGEKQWNDGRFYFRLRQNEKLEVKRHKTKDNTPAE